MIIMMYFFAIMPYTIENSFAKYYK